MSKIEDILYEYGWNFKLIEEETPTCTPDAMVIAIVDELWKVRNEWDSLLAYVQDGWTFDRYLNYKMSGRSRQINIVSCNRSPTSWHYPNLMAMGKWLLMLGFIRWILSYLWRLWKNLKHSSMSLYTTYQKFVDRLIESFDKKNHEVYF